MKCPYRYLAESPSAYQKQFQELLPYIFSVTGESEERFVANTSEVFKKHNKRLRGLNDTIF